MCERSSSDTGHGERNLSALDARLARAARWNEWNLRAGPRDWEHALHTKLKEDRKEIMKRL